jgi:hypothetical protein
LTGRDVLLAGLGLTGLDVRGAGLGLTGLDVLLLGGVGRAGRLVLRLALPWLGGRGVPGVRLLGVRRLRRLRVRRLGVGLLGLRLLGVWVRGVGRRALVLSWAGWAGLTLGAASRLRLGRLRLGRMWGGRLLLGVIWRKMSLTLSSRRVLS